MEDYLGVLVEPWEINSSRHDRIHDALYGFEEKCIVSQEVEQYGSGFFDLVEVEEFPTYWQKTDADRMFVAGDSETTFELISGMEVSSEDISFEAYTVKGFVNYPGTGEVFRDELRSLFPFQERENLVEQNTSFEMLEEMGVPDAEVKNLTDIARPPERSRYYSRKV